MGRDGTEGGLIVSSWRLLSFRWWSLLFSPPQESKRKFRGENLREAKRKLQCKREKCHAHVGSVSGQWDLVAEALTDTHSKQLQLLGDGIRYKSRSFPPCSGAGLHQPALQQ